MASNESLRRIAAGAAHGEQCVRPERMNTSESKMWMFWIAIAAAIPSSIIVVIWLAALIFRADILVASFIVAHNLIVCTRIGCSILTFLAVFILPTVFCTVASRRRTAWLIALSVPVVLVLTYSWWFSLTGQEVSWP